MKYEDLEKKVIELSEDVSNIKRDIIDTKKFESRIKRSIKSIRGSILALSTKDAKKKQKQMLLQAEERGINKEKERKKWIKRFIKWIGAPSLVISLIAVFSAWILGFVKEKEMKIIIQFFKEFNPF